MTTAARTGADATSPKEGKMTLDDTASEGQRNGMGAAMIISWFLFLGPIGCGLLCGVAYAMIVQNLALGIICGLLLFSPLILTATWGGVNLVGLLRERRAKKLAPTPESVMESVQGD